VGQGKKKMAKGSTKSYIQCVESLDQMTTWAVEKFTDVRNKSIDPPAFEGHALTSNELMVSGNEERGKARLPAREV
jgi:hypothetical protein